MAVAERRQLAQRARAARRGIARREKHDQRHGDQREHRHDGEAPAPADRLAEPVSHRHADHGRDGEAQHHPSNRLGPLVRRHQRCGDQRGDAEIGAMGQAGEEAEYEHPTIGRGQRAQHMEQREARHERDEQGTPRELRRRDREQRRTDHHTQGIGADHMARGRLVDAEAARHVRHQAHRREFGGADRKAAHRKREMDQRRVARGRGEGRCRCEHRRQMAMLHCSVNGPRLHIRMQPTQSGAVSIEARASRHRRRNAAALGSGDADGCSPGARGA